MNAIVPAIELKKISSATPLIGPVITSNGNTSSRTNESLPLPTEVPFSLRDQALQVLSMDPHKNIDIKLITACKLFKPCELLNEPDASEIIKT